MASRAPGQKIEYLPPLGVWSWLGIEIRGVRAPARHRGSRVCGGSGTRRAGSRMSARLDESEIRYRAWLAEQGRSLPYHLQKEFYEYLKCDRLEHEFLRIPCSTCHHGRLLRSAAPTVGALGERRGFCPSCGTMRMAESAALLVDEVLPYEPMRQLFPWMACSRTMQEHLPRVLSFPFQLRFLFASRPELMGKVLGIVHRAIAMHLIKKTRLSRKMAQTGAVTLVQRIGSALNLNPNAARSTFTCWFLTGFTRKKIS